MKNIKKILCIALTVLLCFSLIGCNAIDKMRNAQVHFNGDGNIVYNDKEYKQLPACSAFSPDITYDKNLYITDEDVPVLLAEMFGGRAYLTDDEKYIHSNTYSSADGTTAFFARSDIYDSIAARINAGDYFDGFCFYYDFYNEDEYEWKTNYLIISEAAEAAVKEIITTTAPDDEVDIDLMYPYEVTDLYACSNDLLFKEYSITIYQTEKNIYLTAFTGLNEEQVFKVSDKYYDKIKEVVDSYYSLQNNDNYYVE